MVRVTMMIIDFHSYKFPFQDVPLITCYQIECRSNKQAAVHQYLNDDKGSSGDCRLRSPSNCGRDERIKIQFVGRRLEDFQCVFDLVGCGNRRTPGPAIKDGIQRRISNERALFRDAFQFLLFELFPPPRAGLSWDRPANPQIWIVA